MRKDLSIRGELRKVTEEKISQNKVQLLDLQKGFTLFSVLPPKLSDTTSVKKLLQDLMTSQNGAFRVFTV